MLRRKRNFFASRNKKKRKENAEKYVSGLFSVPLLLSSRKWKTACLFLIELYQLIWKKGLYFNSHENLNRSSQKGRKKEKKKAQKVLQADEASKQDKKNYSKCESDKPTTEKTNTHTHKKKKKKEGKLAKHKEKKKKENDVCVKARFHTGLEQKKKT